MSHLLASELLEMAADTNATVTVTKDDGRVLTGSVKPHPTDPDLFTLSALTAAATVHPDDVTEVTFE